MKFAPLIAVMAILSPCIYGLGQEPKRQKGASFSPAVIPHKFEARVVNVLDGDTIRVANAEISVVTVRLEESTRLNRHKTSASKRRIIWSTC